MHAASDRGTVELVIMPEMIAQRMEFKFEISDALQRRQQFWWTPS